MAPQKPRQVESPAPEAEVPAMPTPTPEAVREALTKPTVIMTESDAYIHERLASQPATIEEIRAREVNSPESVKNRLALPDFFERYSYDCTVGQACKAHAWKYDESTNRWSYGNRGEFIFHWTKKTKRAIDHAMNVVEWAFVSRRYFPDAPTYLFSANGGIELGDVILFFMPAKQALLIRNAPGKRSTEILKSRISRTPSGDVLMTGNPDSRQYYLPDAGGDEEGNNVPGLQEDRDF